MSAICFSKSAALLCASFTLFSRATASSCKAVILACSDFVVSSFALLVATSPADSFTTSFGPDVAGIDLSSAALLIFPPADCALVSELLGAASATIPANLLR